MATQSRREKLNALNKKRMDEQHAPKKDTTIVDEMLDNYTKASASSKKADTTKEKSSKSKPAPVKKPSKKEDAVKEVVEEVVAVAEVTPEPEAVPESTEPEVTAPANESFINEPEVGTATVPEKDFLKLLAEQYGLVNVMDKSRVGRPKREGYYQKISLNLKAENLIYAKSVGGKYGGVTGYINYLIEQDMKNNK